MPRSKGKIPRVGDVDTVILQNYPKYRHTIKVYLLWLAPVSLYKIGFTTSFLSYRLASVQTHNPFVVSLVAYSVLRGIEDPRKKVSSYCLEEQNLLKKYKDYQTNGEFFDFPHNILLDQVLPEFKSILFKPPKPKIDLRGLGTWDKKKNPDLEGLL